MFSNPWVTGGIVVVCIAVFHVANTTSIFGKLIDKYYPCIDTPVGVSMPCYAKHDIVIMFWAAIIGLGFLILFVRSLLIARALR